MKTKTNLIIFLYETSRTLNPSPLLLHLPGWLCLGLVMDSLVGYDCLGVNHLVMSNRTSSNHMRHPYLKQGQERYQKLAEQDLSDGRNKADGITLAKLQS